MKPHMITGACVRVTQALDEAMSQGAFTLPPELAAHAAHCPHCGPEVEATERLLARLRGAMAGADLGPVPHLVDRVMARTATECGDRAAWNPAAASGAPAGAGVASATGAPAGAGVASATGEAAAAAIPQEHLRWALGQLAAVAAVLLLLVGGAAFAALKINEAAGGARPAEVVAHLTAPFHNWAEAQFGRNTR